MNIGKLSELSEYDIELLSLESGQCHLFAVELGKLSGESYKIHIGIHKETSVDFEDDICTFSHAVVDIQGVDYDCRGDNAINKWETRWADMYEGVEYIFNWICIDGSPDIEAVLAEIRRNNLSYTEPDLNKAPQIHQVITKNLNLRKVIDNPTINNDWVACVKI